jgi:hypothetical protein
MYHGEFADAAVLMDKTNLLATFADNWLSACSSPSWCEDLDSNHTGRVDFLDFASFAQNW